MNHLYDFKNFVRRLYELNQITSKSFNIEIINSCRISNYRRFQYFRRLITQGILEPLYKFIMLGLIY
jgi:hypothetical protein